MPKVKTPETAITPQEQNNSIVMPAVSPEQAVAAWKIYQEMKNAIQDEEDVQEIRGRKYLKKSYWRKVATFFNLSTEVVEEKSEKLGNTFVWHFTVKATHPNGRSAIGTGSCDMYEKATYKNGEYVDNYDRPAKPNSLHNIRTTAETRATNRAISNLVGGGEVSAEEVDGGYQSHTASQPSNRTYHNEEEETMEPDAIELHEDTKPKDIARRLPNTRTADEFDEPQTKLIDGVSYTRRSGVKNGKPWAGWFPPRNTNLKVVWEDLKVKETQEKLGEDHIDPDSLPF